MSDYRYNNTTSTEDDGIEFIDITKDDDNNKYSEYSDYSEYSGFESTTNSKPLKKSNYAPTLKEEIFSYIKIFLVAIVLSILFTRFVIVNAEVPTGSMVKTIMEHDRLIGNRLAYIFSEPKRGDIIIFKYPDDEKENFVKRVIGVPGDKIMIYGGHVYVNGEMLVETYINEPMEDDGTVQEFDTVPPGCYFVLGDNRNNSKDSRYWKNKYVSRKKILAKVAFRYYSGTEKRISFQTFKQS